MGLVYLVQPEILNGTNRVKVGCSKKSDLSRVKSYGKNCRYICFCHTDYPLETERRILQSFKKHFTLLAGHEYFEGDLREMFKVFTNLINLKEDEYEENAVSNNNNNKVIVSGLISDGIKLFDKLNPINMEVDESVSVSEYSSDVQEDKPSIINNTNNTNIDKKYVNVLECEKCSKILTRQSYLRKHIESCNGLSKLQCEICHKFFKSRQGKYEHKNNVKCYPPDNQSHESNVIFTLQHPHPQETRQQNIPNTQAQSNPTTVNNHGSHNTNNIQNTNNINNNNTTILMFGKEDLSKLMNNPDYMHKAATFDSFISFKRSNERSSSKLL
jgi:hypothetical protein